MTMIRWQLMLAAPPVVLTLRASCILPTTNFHQNFQNFRTQVLSYKFQKTLDGALGLIDTKIMTYNITMNELNWPNLLLS